MDADYEVPQSGALSIFVRSDGRPGGYGWDTEVWGDFGAVSVSRRCLSPSPHRETTQYRAEFRGVQRKTRRLSTSNSLSCPLTNVAYEPGINKGLEYLHGIVNAVVVVYHDFIDPNGIVVSYPLR